MVRYSILRLLIFFGCLALLWLLGLRDGIELAWLAILAGVLSMVISAFVLSPFRAEMVHEIEDRRARRAERKANQPPGVDESAEDAAVDAEDDQYR